MTGRPIHWPQVATEPVVEAAPPPASLLDAVDEAALAATFGPTMSQLFGFRISALPDTVGDLADNDPAGAEWILATRIPLGGAWAAAAATPPAPLDLLIDRASANILVERAYGGRPVGDSPPDDVLSLPPGNASWVAVCRLIGAGACHGLVAGGAAPAVRLDTMPVVPGRAAQLPLPRGAALLALRLDVDGLAGRALLVDPNSIAPPVEEPEPAPLPNPDIWRRRTHSRALDMDLPVALRLADLKLEVTRLATLAPGDILPLARPRRLSVVVAGKVISSFAAGALAASPEHPGDTLSEGEQP